ncbi:hypothetical protein GCM10007116_13220 [Sulfodiicoccus acidiphilus]|nr:hypothetical protein GCM10007116_13220 [Sulfodiicoccus acidiphilus]
MSKRRKKIRVLVVGNFTFDLIDGKRYPGGPPLYAGMGVVAAGGIPLLLGNYGPDYPLDILSFPHELIGERGPSTTTFGVSFVDGVRRMEVLSNAGSISEKVNVDADGVLVDPVCGEVREEFLRGVKAPLAVDVQGFVRPQCGLRPIPPLGQVLHSNFEEYSTLKSTLQELSLAGNREVLLSFDSDGFILVGDSRSRFVRTDMKGERTVGNGDFLLAAFFTLRLSGYDLWEAGEKAKWLVEAFSNSLPTLS